MSSVVKSLERSVSLVANEKLAIAEARYLLDWTAATGVSKGSTIERHNVHHADSCPSYVPKDDQQGVTRDSQTPRYEVAAVPAVSWRGVQLNPSVVHGRLIVHRSSPLRLTRIKAPDAGWGVDMLDSNDEVVIEHGERTQTHVLGCRRSGTRVRTTP